MINRHSKSKISALASTATGVAILFLAIACGPSAEDRAAAEQAAAEQAAADRAAADLECRQLATARTGYDPANPAADKSAVGKGAAVGAVSGAALGAITGNKSKNIVKGAAVGAAVGAGAGALKNNEDRKRAEQAANAYQAEYQHCMSGKGN